MVLCKLKFKSIILYHQSHVIVPRQRNNKNKKTWLLPYIARSAWLWHCDRQSHCYSINSLLCSKGKELSWIISRISWKAQKHQVNIIFPSNFWLKKDCNSHLWKVQSKNFSVIGKYHLSMDFLAQKREYFLSTSWLRKRPYLLSPKSSKQE